MNISSVVVRAKPGHVEDVITGINALDLCEVHFYDSEGKIVATIEGESISDQMASLKHIQKIPFVLNANVAYSYCEDELSEALEQIRDRQDSMP